MAEENQRPESQGREEGPEEFPLGPGYTGNYLIGVAPAERLEAADRGMTALSEVAGVSVDVTVSGGDIDLQTLADPQASILFEDFGIARVPALDQERVDEVAAVVDDSENPVSFVVPEAINVALTEGSEEEEWVGGAEQSPFQYEPEAEGPTAEHLLAAGAQYSREFLEGYRAAVQNLLEKLAAMDLGLLASELAPTAFDESEFTWGLQVTKAARSSFTGRGIRVAVLDTSLDLQHPDFRPNVRRITSQSFVPNQTPQDGHGHGTHCIGTACGPRVPPGPPGGGRPRSYGCAQRSEIFAGKVLSNQGSGQQSWILAGMQWAIAQRCMVVSMSLGVNACNTTDRRFNAAYEQVGRVALQRGTLIVAAAGNASNRPSRICGIHPDSPAAAPSIMAVGALDEALQPAVFSNGGLFPPHGAVDIAAPGVNTFSSWPRPTLYRRISGTSMATPHVAGIAALWAEANSRFRGVELGRQLLRSARRLPLPPRDVGAGLVQAP